MSAALKKSTNGSTARCSQTFSQPSSKRKRKTPEEGQLFELVTKLIEDFEEEHYPIPDAPPHRILRFLMEQNDLRQSDLLQIFGSRGYVSVSMEFFI